ncbi:MAG: sulfatase-like hydrolase/transferase [Eubacteriales bacterium]|jgi:lipoteichoic acid synthase
MTFRPDGFTNRNKWKRNTPSDDEDIIIELTDDEEPETAGADGKEATENREKMPAGHDAEQVSSEKDGGDKNREKKSGKTFSPGDVLADVRLAFVRRNDPAYRRETAKRRAENKIRRAERKRDYLALQNRKRTPLELLLWFLPEIVKYVYAVVMTIRGATVAGDASYAWIGFLELAAIFALSNAIVGRNRVAAYIVNYALMLAYNLQYMFLYFSGSYLTLVMITNTDSLNGLSGRTVLYGFTLILMIVCSCLPIRHVRMRGISSTGCLSVALAIELAATMGLGGKYSAFYGLYSLYAAGEKQAKLASSAASGENMTSEFYQGEVQSNITKPANLSEKPNVVLIFTEGISQNIVEDDRNIMPNVKAYENKSINFTNYYNHTFATYRGLIGQLYSGYQLENYDTSTLVSIEDIFKAQGYQTAFINTEPLNLHFLSYLDSMNFDTVVADKKNLDGPNQSMSDKDAYSLLYETITDQSTAGKPFFTCIYTYGTHLSLDSPDEKYGDGSNTLLNKFYNDDVQFGNFMSKLYSGKLGDNTIVIFTGDHCAYADQQYLDTFPDYSRQFGSVDRIPLFIYYKGIEKSTIDAAGRNSLDLAPTILDYLDMSAPNYFLGCTLFADAANNNSYDTIYYDSDWMLSTGNGDVEELTDTEKSIMESQLTDYFKAKQQTPETVEDAINKKNAEKKAESTASSKKAASAKAASSSEAG